MPSTPNHLQQQQPLRSFEHVGKADVSRLSSHPIAGKQGGPAAHVHVASPLGGAEAQQKYKVPGLPASANGNGNGIKAEHETERGSALAGPSASTTNGPAHRTKTEDDGQYSPYFRQRRLQGEEGTRISPEEDAAFQPPTREELEAQLRPEEEGLVPLSAIALRIVHHAWHLFANQSEINPSLPPLERRKRIYDDAHEARKQLIKLLVLVQWSRSAPELLVARNLIALINDHITQTDVAVAALSETRNILDSAGLRNYDLLTAVDVLSRGVVQRVPPLVKDLLHADKPYTDREALSLVHELNDVLTMRLASEELLSMSLLSYTIRDGRASFVAPDLFEADLTLSGPSSDDRWWLLRVKFDFHITGDGADRFPRQLRGQQRLTLISLADAELAPRSVAAAEEAEDTQANEVDEPMALEAGEDRIPSTLTAETTLDRRKDTPLIRLYNLLQSQSLHYRLDILHWQATQLVRLSWGQRLNVIVDDERVLHIRYWQNARIPQGNTASEWNPTQTAELRITVSASKPVRGSTAIVKSIFEKKDDRGQKVLDMQLEADWDVGGAAVDFLDSRHVNIDHRSLDAEALVQHITQRHAKAAIQAFQARLQASTLGRRMTTQIRTRSASESQLEESTLLIGVHSRLTVEMKVDRMSGQIDLSEASDLSDSVQDDTLTCAALANLSRLNYIRDASKAINEKPNSIINILQRLRCQVSIEDMSEKCALSNLPFTTRLPLRQVDFAQLRGSPGSLLFVAMQQCLGYYLVLHLGDESIDVSLIYVVTFMEDMITSMRIMSLERLDWRHVLESCKQGSLILRGKRRHEEAATYADATVISEDELAILHSYSVALISYHKIEEQLRQRGVSFLHVEGSTGRKVPSQMFSNPAAATHDKGSEFNSAALSAVVPSLCVDASSFLGSLSKSSSFVKRNILVRLRHWNDPLRTRVEIALKAGLRKEVVTRERLAEGTDEIRFDSKTGVLIFSIANVEDCFVRFISCWRRIEKVLELVNVLWLQQSKKSKRHGEAKKADTLDFALDAFDLVRVSIRYAGTLVAKVGWVVDPSKRKGGFFSLSFSHTDETSSGENPHQVLREALQDTLNNGDEGTSNFWPSFLRLLRRTLPIARAVSSLPLKCLDDVHTPELEVKSAVWIRLIFLGRFVFDVRLLANRFVLFVDANRQTLSVQDRSKGDKQPDQSVDDDFSLHILDNEDADETEALSGTMDWDTIPHFDQIVTEIGSKFGQRSDHAQNQGQEDGQAVKRPPILLTFPSALLYRGETGTALPILEEFMDRIRTTVANIVDV